MPDSSLEPAVTRHHGTNAEDFLQALSPQWTVWQPDPSCWVFRGHSRADYELKAKAHRDADDFCRKYGVDVPGLPVGMTVPRWSTDEKRFKALLAAFGKALDAAGLPYPTISPDLVPRPRTMLSSDPEHHQWPLVGLAQHLGLPTPWLDWAQLGRVAAYFAAVGAARKKQTTPDIAVWALRRDFVDATKEEGVGRVGMRMMTLPRASNERLHAQGGVFTWLRGEDAHDATVDTHTAKLAELHGPRLGFIGAVMRCFTLEATEAPKLLRLLSYEGVTAATIYPGYEGVVRAMEERSLWDHT